MRAIEILLSLFSFLILLQFFTLFRVGEEIGRWLALAGGILLLIHLGIEGMRWQMLGIYAVILGYSLSVFLRTPVDSVLVKWLLFAFGSLTTVLSIGLAYLLPVFSLPVPQGPYALVAEDRSTEEPIYYRIWFPVEEPPKNSSPISYHSDPRKELNGVMGMPGFVFSHLKNISTHALGMEVLTGSPMKYPLVIYSHGASSSQVDNTGLVEAIASHGYVVVAINHDFRFEKYGIDPAVARTVEVEAQQELINQLVERVVPAQVTHYGQLLASLERDFGTQIDFAHIALLGHSLGGTTACSGGLSIPNVQGVINMDGPIDPDITANFSKPLLYLSSFSPDLSDEALKAQRVPPAFYRAVKKYELAPVKALFEEPREEQYWIRFSEANHLDFTDLPYLIPFISAPNYDRAEGHALKSAIILAFLNRVLQGAEAPIDWEGDGAEWVLSPAGTR
ncbi:MAG: hypothetical protein AAGH79_07685 [Bacteroidota bacterium]